jgi:enoyl-CoA hydratase/carnithine racemase
VGFGRAKELVLTGEIISAEEACRHGLVSRVVEDEALMAEARGLAERLRAKAPQALGIAKRVLQNCVSADLQTSRTLESFGQSILIKTTDHREGVNAFREKRRPRFEGR